MPWLTQKSSDAVITTENIAAVSDRAVFIKRLPCGVSEVTVWLRRAIPPIAFAVKDTKYRQDPT